MPVQNEEIFITYGGVRIVYNDAQQNWEFTLRGRSRSAPSVSKAKEAIDAPPKTTKKSFTPIEAYLRVSGRWEKVCVTSLIEGRAGVWREVWVNREDGRRRKEYIDNIYPADIENAKLLAIFNELEDQVNALRKQQNETMAKMSKINPGQFE